MKKAATLILIAALAAACSDRIDDTAVQPAVQPAATTYAKDKYSIRLKPAVVAAIDNRARTLAVPTGSDILDSYLRSVGAKAISRIFPYAGRDEGRQREAGLNLWYTVRLDTAATTRATADVAMADGNAADVATCLEPVYAPRLERATYTPVDETALTRASDTPFNDPLYARQWDFRNDGTVGNTTDSLGNRVTSSIAGADINVEPAWRQTTGDPAVVVAVVDGGIDTSHPDLAASMWVNEGEIPGNGIDDDDNGYVDDYYGYNFAADTCAIMPTRHGTHVAGTIAARNNNGRGVCGIAGGDGSPQSGVRLMSCQIFRNNPDYDPSDPNSSETIGTGDRNLDAAAIVYGANNGAVICQNSWGFDLNYTATPQVIKEAIDYFNRYAGGDKTSRPVMQGGVVIFAAGNDGTRQATYPASDDNVISVAAYNPDFQASWYTNYGETVDISAPGGSQPEKGKYPYEDGLPTSAVLSCVPVGDDGRGGWAYMQGSSMACPHVSGIAALIASKYGGPDFTADELRQRLLAGVKSLDYNDYVLPQYFDGMGLGYADALAALTDHGQAATPSAPRFLTDSTRAGYGSITVAWTSDNSADDGSLQYYIFYYSGQPITEADADSAGSHRVSAVYAAPGQVFRRTFNRLQANKPYYFAVRAVSRDGRQSPLAVYDGSISTLFDNPPVITADIEGNRLTLAGRDTKTIRFHLSDPEGHAMSYTFTDAGSMDISEEGNDIVVTVNAWQYLPGIYPVRLTVRDQYGATTHFDFVIEILADRTPTLKASVGELHVAKGGNRDFPIADIVDDEAPAQLAVAVTGSTNVSASVSDGTLHLAGAGWGQGTVTLSATDIHGQKGEFEVPVFVYDNEGIYALYPTTATTTLYLKVGDTVSGEAEVTVRNTAGKQALSRTFNTASLDRVKRTLLISVGDLKPGAYTLTLKNNGRTWQQKFVKK